MTNETDPAYGDAGRPLDTVTGLKNDRTRGDWGWPFDPNADLSNGTRIFQAIASFGTPSDQEIMNLDGSITVIPGNPGNSSEQSDLDLLSRWWGKVGT